MTATIPLSKGLDISKLKFPVYFSEKLDGVPVKLTVNIDSKTTWFVRTRSDEVSYSTADDMSRFVFRVKDYLPAGQHVFVFETTHTEYKLFKDISGVVRRQEPQEGLVYNLFDYWTDTAPNAAFCRRIEQGQSIVISAELYRNFKVVRQTPIATKEHLEAALAEPMADGQEGWIIRSYDAEFKPGARHWDYQKVVKEPMIDLLIMGVLEGKGKNAGAVGTLVARYKGGTIGVGPGKLSYAERKALWELWQTPDVDRRRIAQIKYKPDEGYTALRQPTFQCWRDDKDTPDA